MSNSDDTGELSTEINKTYDFSYVKKGLWNPTSFIIISLLFSFLPAVIMYSINYGRLGQAKKRTFYLISGFILFILMVFVSMFFNASILKAVTYSINVALGMYMRNDQRNMYDNYINAGGKKASLVLPVILCIALTTLVIVSIVYSANIPDKKLTFQGDDLYYTDNITKEETNKLGLYLEDYGLIVKDNKTISLKIDKKQNAYILSIVINKNYLNDKSTLESVKDLCKDLSLDVFNNKKVEVDLCDNNFKNLKTISD